MIDNRLPSDHNTPDDEILAPLGGGIHLTTHEHK